MRRSRRGRSRRRSDSLQVTHRGRRQGLRSHGMLGEHAGGGRSSMGALLLRGCPCLVRLRSLAPLLLIL
eukprot:95317-Hanusia_phi.AAC.3